MKKLAVFALLLAFVCTLGCSGGDTKSTTAKTVTSTGQTTTGNK